MKKLLSWLKSVKWWLWLVVAGAVALVLLAIRKGMSAFAKPEAVYQLPPVPPAVQARVDKAQETALVARVEAHAKAETKTQELQAVQAIPDGAERRKKLAALLQSM